MMFSLRKVVQLACAAAMVTLNDGVNGLQMTPKDAANNAFLQKKETSGSPGSGAKETSKTPTKPKKEAEAATNVAIQQFETAVPQQASSKKGNALSVWMDTMQGNPAMFYGLISVVLIYMAAICYFGCTEDKDADGCKKNMKQYLLCGVCCRPLFACCGADNGAKPCCKGDE